MRMFLLKLVVRSVAIDVASWLALIVTSAILAVTVTLDIGLVVAGASTSGEAQQAFVAFGGVALGFCCSGGSTVLPAGRASGGTGMVSVRASYFFQRAALE